MAIVEDSIAQVAGTELSRRERERLTQVMMSERDRMDQQNMYRLMTQRDRLFAEPMRIPIRNAMFGGFLPGPDDIPVPERPTTEMLRALMAPELKTDSRTALAVECEDLLGYTPLRNAAGAPSRLQRLLAKLEITVFDPATVKAYKEKMRGHHQALAAKKDVEANRQRMSSPNSMWGYMETRVSWNMIPLRGYGAPVPEFVLRKCTEIKRHAPEANFFVDELREQSRIVDPFMVVTLGEEGEDVNLDEAAWFEVWNEPEFEKNL